MDRKRTKKIYEAALAKYGYRSQMEMLQEEATELALATRKQLRSPNDENLTNLAEEIADVKIMLEQLSIIYPEIIHMSNDWFHIKMERLEKNLKEQK